jgi:hypothetical protein
MCCERKFGRVVNWPNLCTMNVHKEAKLQSFLSLAIDGVEGQCEGSMGPIAQDTGCAPKPGRLGDGEHNFPCLESNLSTSVCRP